MMRQSEQIALRLTSGAVPVTATKTRTARGKNLLIRQVLRVCAQISKLTGSVQLLSLLTVQQVAAF